MKHIIRTSSRLGAIVLDCFAGSGTTLVASINQSSVKMWDLALAKAKKTRINLLVEGSYIIIKE